MKVLSTIKEYAKLKGLSDIAVRKRVTSKYNESIIIDKIIYIIHEDTQIDKLKNRLKNSNAKIREMKLKLEIKTDVKYLNEIEKQNRTHEKKIRKLEKQILKLHNKKDTIYEKALASILKQIPHN
jgi:hypothetical protein